MPAAPKSPSLKREAAAWSRDRFLIGVDEAGRGPLAGPVVAAAVVFPREVNRQRVRFIRDSKSLPEPKRDRAALVIRRQAFAIGVGAASVTEIDTLNIRRATVLAMRRAIARIVERPATRCLTIDQCEVVLDGLAMPDLGFDHDAMVDGDVHCLSISAAGIIAKTVRDRLMSRLAPRYPTFQWQSNRGYGTDTHRRAIEQHGPTRHHRQSFYPVAQLSLDLVGVLLEDVTSTVLTADQAETGGGLAPDAGAALVVERMPAGAE